MAKDTSNTSGIKHRVRFNEQVNLLLIIMFLAVVSILFIKGCSIGSVDGDTGKEIKENVAQNNDNTQRDSITNIQIEK